GLDTGFAATVIPASDAGPHQAKLTHDRYFRRSGASFRTMEHFEIEDMFGRRPRPLLTLAAQFIVGGQSTLPTVSWHHSPVLSILNSGRGTARAPLLAIAPKLPWFRRGHGLDGSEREGLRRLVHTQGTEWIRYGGDMTSVIHPGTRHDVCSITCALANGQ